jgi:NAD(P)-dependent dehydrogenase (short-subunit alcohol dehydrogenase family)
MSEHLVVTGTSGAIGAAVTRALRARHPRARFTLVDLNVEPSRALAAEIGGEVEAVHGDLSQSEDAQRVLDDARGRFGPVFGLVNCAGFAAASPIALALAPVQVRTGARPRSRLGRGPEAID